MANMSLDDFRKLKGIMNRTFSDSDNESLNAIRLANKILTKYDINWERVLDRSVQLDVPVESMAEATGEIDPDDMERLFELAFEGTRRGSGFYDTLQSIHEQWETRHHLSPRQHEVVKNAAERARGLR